MYKHTNSLNWEVGGKCLGIPPEIHVRHKWISIWNGSERQSDGMMNLNRIETKIKTECEWRTNIKVTPILSFPRNGRSFLWNMETQEIWELDEAKTERGSTWSFLVNMYLINLFPRFRRNFPHHRPFIRPPISLLPTAISFSTFFCRFCLMCEMKVL